MKGALGAKGAEARVAAPHSALAPFVPRLRGGFFLLSRLSLSQ